MRIAVFPGIFPSLSETFVLNQITGLIDRGHTIDLYPAERANASLHHPDVDRYDLLGRIRYVPEPPPATGLRRASLRLGLDLLRRKSLLPLRVLHPKYRRSGSRAHLLLEATRFPSGPAYDVLYAPFGPNGLRVARLRSLGILSGALAVSFMGYDLTQVPRRHGPRVYDLLFRQAALCLPCSETARQQLLALGAPPLGTVVHRLGIDCGRFAFAARRPPEDGPVRLLSVARLVEKKGLAYAIRAVAALPPEQAVRYDIVGDGPLRGKLDALIDALGARDRIRLLGPRDTDGVRAAMQASHLFLAPSVTAENGDSEGTPVVLMEALASGLPVVTTLHSGIPELVIDGRTGRLVAERDAGALTAALTDLLATPDAWAAYGRAGRSFVEAHHDIDALNDRLVARFEQLSA